MNDKRSTYHKMKPFLIITGMHRSGTSFLIRALNLSGVYLGELESLTSNQWKAKKDNPKGHWENKKFLELTEKTISFSKGSWHEIPEKISINNEIAEELKRQIKNLMQHPSLASGFKDPRILLCLDSWLNYLPKNFVLVGIFRNPLKVAESLKKRDNFSYEKSINLWKIYNKKLLGYLEKHDGFLLDFDWPKEKLLSETQLISKKLGLMTNIDLSDWYSKELFIADKTFQSNYPLDDETLSLYSQLKQRSEKNKQVKVKKIHLTLNQISNILQNHYNEVIKQGDYFKQINDENLNKIKELRKANELPLDQLLEIYNSRSDLQNAFPDVKNGNLVGLLNWAVNVKINEAGNNMEKSIIQLNRELYRRELERANTIIQLNTEKKQQEELVSKLSIEKKQQEELVSKLLTEKKQQEENISQLGKTTNDLESDLKIAHRVIQEKEHERVKVNEELSAIKNSSLWQLFAKIQNSLIKIFPERTSRGSFLYLTRQFFRFSKRYGVGKSTKLALAEMKKKRFRLLDPIPSQRQQLKTWKSLQNFDDAQIANIKKEVGNFRIKPKISIILPVFNIDEKWLRMAIESVRNQIYENWELCIVDDASTKPHIKPILTEYSKKDPERIKVKFLEKNQNISGSSNEALSLVKGQFVGLLDHDDEIYQNALYEIADPDLDILYSDENHVTPEGERIDPFFKPNYSPDLLLCCHYMVHFIVYRTSLLQSIGGFRKGFEGSQDYDLVLRAVERTNKIHHIPKSLYGWRNLMSSTAVNIDSKRYAPVAAKKALTEALKRRNVDAIPEYMPELGYFRIKYNIKKTPLVSLIIVTHDRPNLLSVLLSSIEKRTTYPNYEILIIDRKSETKKAIEFLKTIKKHKVIRYNKELNISEIYNFGERHANGEYLLLMNDDLEVISEDWIEAMLGPCQRKEVGVVGAQLIYPEESANGIISGNTIQHAGIVLGIGGIAGHAFRHVPYLQNGYFALNKTIRNYSAVTGACMLVKRKTFNEVKGYDPLLKVSYGDVDFCLRVKKAGYLIIYTPFAKLYHLEGATRGVLHPTEDAITFVKRWRKELYKIDPYYNPNLTLLRENFALSFSGLPIEETLLALLIEIYASRQDLQKSFPEVISNQYQNLINWAATYGATGPKFGIPEDPHSNILKLHRDWFLEHSKKGEIMKKKVDQRV